MQRYLITAFRGIFFIFITGNLRAQDWITGKTFAMRSQVISRHDMVATSQPLAAQVGLQILKKVVMPLMPPLRLMRPWA